MSESVIQLKCNCNNYPWGKRGSDSLAARLASKIPGTDFRLDENKDYAEMWMGTYPTTPAYVLKTGELLQDVINANSEALVGKTVLSKFGTDLPFLPKILSISKALPLQIHPNKDLASKLHEKDPEKFSDGNHKPEIAIALTDFEAFCGFKPNQDIQHLASLEPLKPYLRDGGSKTFNDETVRQMCKEMLVADEKTVASTMDGLKKLSENDLGDNRYIAKLIPRLEDQYGKTDNGSLVALVLMNFLRFSPGEAIWIPADGIHAYLYGDIVECMARSDNVINTGFCPRPDRDSADLFTQSLTFKQHDSTAPKLAKTSSEFSKNGFTQAFKPPMGEFNMLVTNLESGEAEELRPVQGPSIAFVTSGKGVMRAGERSYELNEGCIFFIGHNTPVKVESEGSLAFYRAYAE